MLGETRDLLTRSRSVCRKHGHTEARPVNMSETQSASARAPAQVAMPGGHVLVREPAGDVEHDDRALPMDVIPVPQACARNDLSYGVPREGFRRREYVPVAGASSRSPSRHSVERYITRCDCSSASVANNTARDTCGTHHQHAHRRTSPGRLCPSNRSAACHGWWKSPAGAPPRRSWLQE